MKPTLKLCTSHSFDRDLKDAGLVTSLEPVPLRSTGDHSGEFDRRCKTKHTQREGLYVLRRSELGVEESVTDISRVLTHLTKKDVEFKWTPECENCFQILKEFLQEAPILRYPDPQANYTLYTDASKYAYAGILTQHYNGTDHPITYVSGLFCGSQLNWATLTKEAYAIYMSVKKLSFYIDTAKITVKSDHLPLKKFLEKNTLNSKVNNWAVELESQDITFEYIPGIRNTLADTLSRLIEMDENIQLQPEEEGKEFGYFPFEELPPVTTQVLEEVIVCEIGNISIQHTDPVEINTDIQLPLKEDKLAKLQESDPHTRQLRKQWESKNLDQNMYMMENNILKRKLVENGLLYIPIVVPDVLRDCLLILAHDKQGHNGFRRTYASLKNRYHWKGMKKAVYQHCTNCQLCAKHNIKTQQLKNEHFSSPPQPMEFIAMDLIGEFHPASSKGNRFALMQGYTRRNTYNQLQARPDNNKHRYTRIR